MNSRSLKKKRMPKVSIFEPENSWLSFFLRPLIIMAFCIITGTILKVSFGAILEFANALNPYEAKIKDFELSDFCFAYTHQVDRQDADVVILNCNKNNREEIAKKINQIAKYPIKCLGVDISFENKDSTGSEALIDAFNKIRAKVVFGRLDQSAEKHGPDLLDIPFYKKLQVYDDSLGSLRLGFIAQEHSLSVKRIFKPYLLRPDGSADTSFEVAIAKIALPDTDFAKCNALLQTEKIINYRKYSFDGPRFQVIENLPDSLDVSNRIVLLGSIDTTDLADMHFTPLNGMVGKSLPDMSGIEYHAHILSMIFNNDYIKKVPNQQLYVWLVCYLCVMYFIFLHHRYKYLYHYLFDISFVAMLLILMVISAICLEHGYKLEPMDFLVPIFTCGFFLHFYDWANHCYLVNDAKINIRRRFYDR